MPRRRPNNGPKVGRNIVQPANVLQAHKQSSQNTLHSEQRVEGIDGIKSLLEDEDVDQQPGTSSLNANNLSSNTAALYDELDSFRQRWKRELESKKDEPDKVFENISRRSTKNDQGDDNNKENESNKSYSPDQPLKDSFSAVKENNPTKIYALAKKLFLIGVDLERDDMQHESIRYYKQAMHLCPDIEKQIFREQCEASARTTTSLPDEKLKSEPASEENEDKIPIVERIRQSHREEMSDGRFVYCCPAFKPKHGSLHLSDLPHEIMLQIFRYVIGQELDLASLESVGMVSRGLFLLSRDQTLWRSICYSTWGNVSFAASDRARSEETKQNKNSTAIDWRQTYLDKPRVNYDGVYISRTRYIRQGDAGFQDLTYRPFHVIHYYRYLRFFPDRRVLILTTNEEPERIVPIFRHALRSKQFSSELSILEGTYDFCFSSNEISIVADKEFRALPPSVQSQRAQAQFQWSRQTPLAQKFNLKFELKTIESKPYKNNVLKWLDYTISTKFESGHEITTFDLSFDTFPNLIFSRVKRFNLKLTKPLSSH